MNRLTQLSIRAALMASALFLIHGCSIIYKTTGHVVASLSEDAVVPYMLAQDDMQMACNSYSLSPLISSFEEVGTDIRELGILLYSVGGLCTQVDAQKYEMSYLMAIKNGDGMKAQDSLTLFKRTHKQAAKNYLRSYNYMIDFFEPEENECPDFDNDFQELTWLLGQMSGALALLSDSSADLSVGIPRNIPAKVEGWIGCIDNEKWWGAPNGLQAAVWTTLPAVAPENANPPAVLVNSQNLSLETGVRIGYALRAMSMLGEGKTAQVKQVIRDFAKTNENGFTPDPNFKMIDTIAEQIILGISDVIWGKEEGMHTPFGSLGTFANDAVEEEPAMDFDLDDLL